MFKKFVKTIKIRSLQLKDIKTNEIILCYLGVHDLQVAFFTMLKILR